MQKFAKHRWFSILMALGITAILMIVVTGLAAIYVRELKLSRLSYDEVIVQSSAEWMFEYAMLKIYNHEDGFSDTVDVSVNDLDADMFRLSTPRSQSTETKYQIEGNSTDYQTYIDAHGFLVIPLFVGTDELLSHKSKNPLENNKIERTKKLFVTWLNSNSSWTIAATDENGQSIALQGTGAIVDSTTGTIDIKRYLCTYVVWSLTDSFEDSVPCDQSSDNKSSAYKNTVEKEELMYIYRIDNVKVQKFLQEWSIDVGNGKHITTLKERNFPYLVVYNNTDQKLENVRLKSNTSFALPQYQVTATAQKGNASQVFRFSEDKGALYDVLKYGYYGTTDNP